MEKHLGIGMLTTILVIMILYVLLGFFDSPYIFAIIIVALFLGTIATCTSMILEKLDSILELTAAQSAKLRSLETKEAETKQSSDD